MDIHATGNALTNDSFLCLLKEAEAEKQEKHKQKSNKEVMEPVSDVSDADEDVNHCFSCGEECVMARRNVGLAVMSATVGTTTSVLGSPSGQSAKKTSFVQLAAPNY